ncbi:MAG TPA: hypothetical protein VES61_03410 [Gaiellaceae bacterium]|nr:hypothetical protein [Gaiellaceae bacterium]
MRRRRFLALSVASLAALVGTGAAQAVIVPQSSIAGIKLGMTRAEVRAHSGRPSTIVHAMNDFGPYTTFRYFRLRVTFQGNEGATAVSTTRRRQATPAGIHVLSTESQLRAAYPGARCRTEFENFRHCWIGRFEAGRRVTDFRISTGRVRSILVGFVID